MPLALLDLNDTLIRSNRPDGFVLSREDYCFLDGALDALDLWVREGWDLAIVTNQPGHHRFPDQVDEAAMRGLMADMASGFRFVLGKAVGMYVCYHDATPCDRCGGKGFTMCADTFDMDTYKCMTCDGYGTFGCECRKPRPGLILEALRDYGTDPKDVVMVGDKWSDVMAAHSAMVPSVLIGSFSYEAKGRSQMPNGVPPPMLWVPDVWEAAVVTVARARMGDPRA